MCLDGSGRTILHLTLPTGETTNWPQVKEVETVPFYLALKVKFKSQQFSIVPGKLSSFLQREKN